ncbi:TetR/AcrR family transcriptional regulator (plasmid) [Deinococcus sp. KNUC1210]|uniref:TetR/AcrR family transcriptional regulator n=1 Tax=Deinococcus sp. KNUC1210 TaxID=2917691 RepID=UPI001EF10BCE|nr:TetR/AcrR family transcriptional regulator [Deinococcus sp. KNUC1210]ULH14108.1 TetR/AcrR family transcriptional regulator [Deinococcus sp. KNUC1210]
MTAVEHRKRLAAADRRQQILDASADLFVSRGFEAVSMADIAQVLQVSRPTVYSYFTSPEAVLDSLMTERLHLLWTRLEVQIVALMPGRSGTPPPPQMYAALFHFLLDERQTLELLHCGGGPGFQARRLAFLGELARRLEVLRPSILRFPHLPMLLTHLLDSVAFSAVRLPPEHAEELAQTLDAFVRGGVTGLPGHDSPEDGSTETG